MSQKKSISRRDFLRYSAAASATAAMPMFLDATAAVAQDPASGPAGKREPIPGFKDDHILVVVQLGGGNDGLNTVVPFRNDDYRRARPALAVPQNRVLKLAEDGPGADIGLHERLAPLKELYDNGLVGVINGVGYPNPNRSHFRSMEIWHTASDSDRYEKDGWIGRYFHNCCSGTPEAVCAVNLGSDLPQAFDGMRHGVGFQQPQLFQWEAGVARDTDEAFRSLNRLSAQQTGDRTIDFLRHVTSNIVLSSDRVKAAASRTRRNVQYPGSRLSQPLQTIAGLIAAEMPTRLYYASLGGFDTHANQQGGHENLLAQVSGCLRSFMADLRANGQADRVLVMVFSEFGRRVEENGSRGTDHGTAGPMFLVGEPVRAGVYGTYPGLTDLDRGDLKHTVDFRSVYASVLEQWLDVRHDVVLRKKFPLMDLVKS